MQDIYSRYLEYNNFFFNQNLIIAWYPTQKNETSKDIWIHWLSGTEKKNIICYYHHQRPHQLKKLLYHSLFWKACDSDVLWGFRLCHSFHSHFYHMIDISILNRIISTFVCSAVSWIFFSLRRSWIFHEMTHFNLVLFYI